MEKVEGENPNPGNKLIHSVIVQSPREVLRVQLQEQKAALNESYHKLLISKRGGGILGLASRGSYDTMTFMIASNKYQKKQKTILYQLH